MASFPGLTWSLTGTANSDDDDRVSANLEGMTAPPPWASNHSKHFAGLAGIADPFQGYPEITPRFDSDLDGVTSDRLGPADRWFERFFVIFDGAAFGQPAVRDLGYLLSNQEMKFELWNTHRSETRTLLSLTPQGPTGVDWDDPYGVPLDYRPLQARLYDVAVRLAGAPEILNWLALTWNEGLLGPDATVRGLRVIPIPIEPDWSEGFDEGPVYRTDIFLADDGSEQRVRMRPEPRHRIRYRLIPFGDRELQLLDQLLWGWSRYAYGIPLWPDALRLRDVVEAGATTVTLDTAERRFAAGGNILLLTDAFTWEAAHVIEVSETGLVLEDQVQSTWPIHRTWVVPLAFGRLDNDIPVDRPSSGTAIVQIDALCQPLVTG